MRQSAKKLGISMDWGVTFFIFTFETVFPENP